MQGAGIETTGSLLEQIKLNSDKVLGLQGIGPKAMVEINKLVNMLLPSKAEAEKPAEVVAVPEEVAAVEPEKVEVPEPVEEQTEPVVEKEPSPAEQELSFDELFKLETIKKEAVEEEEETEGDVKDKKKQKVKSVVVEYDPDRDITIAHKKHKRGDDTFTDDV